MNTTTTMTIMLFLAHLASPYPTGQPRAELLLLQDLLDKLEPPSEQPAEELDVPGLRGEQEVEELDEALIRELLSAKNLKAVKNNSNRSSSGCFGRRMDRIGSMSSLGCNTVGRNDAKSS